MFGVVCFSRWSLVVGVRHVCLHIVLTAPKAFTFGAVLDKPADAGTKAADAASKPASSGFAFGIPPAGGAADAAKPAPAFGLPGAAAAAAPAAAPGGAAPFGLAGAAAKPIAAGFTLGGGAAPADPAKKAADPLAALNPAGGVGAVGAAGAAAGALVPAPAVALVKEVTADEMMKGKTINQLIAAWCACWGGEW